jgi:hypothetical protein
MQVFSSHFFDLYTVDHASYVAEVKRSWRNSDFKSLLHFVHVNCQSSPQPRELPSMQLIVLDHSMLLQVVAVILQVYNDRGSSEPALVWPIISPQRPSS